MARPGQLVARSHLRLLGLLQAYNLRPGCGASTLLAGIQGGYHGARRHGLALLLVSPAQLLQVSIVLGLGNVNGDGIAIVPTLSGYWYGATRTHFSDLIDGVHYAGGGVGEVYGEGGAVSGTRTKACRSWNRSLGGLLDLEQLALHVELIGGASEGVPLHGLKDVGLGGLLLVLVEQLEVQVGRLKANGGLVLVARHKSPVVVMDPLLEEIPAPAALLGGRAQEAVELLGTGMVAKVDGLGKVGEEQDAEPK